MSLALAFALLALAGSAILGGAALLVAKVFDVPLFGAMLLPLRLLFIAVLGFCIAYTANGLAARFAGIDIQRGIERRLERILETRSLDPPPPPPPAGQHEGRAAPARR